MSSPRAERRGRARATKPANRRSAGRARARPAAPERAAKAPVETGPPPAPPEAGATAAPPRGMRQALAAFAYPNYAIFWVGGLCSNIARWMQDAIVPYVIYRLTSNAGLVGVAAFVRFIPGVVIAPLAGSIADRFPRRTVLVVTHAGLVAVSACFWLAWTAGVASAPLLIGLAGLAGLVVGLTLPAWHALIPELVPREHMFGALTLNSAHVNAAKAIGPSVGGVILATGGAGWAFFVTALLFASVILTLTFVRVPRRAPARVGRRVMRQFIDLTRDVARRPELVVCALVMMGVAVLGMPIVQLAPVFATDVFRVGPDGFGILAGALGVGGVLSAPILSAWTRGIARSRLIGTSMLWYGLTMVLFAHSTVFPLGVAAMALVGAGFLFVNSTINTTVQLAVDDDIRGRIVALYLTGWAASYPLGSLVQGWVAERVGAPATVTGAGVLIVAGALAFLASPAVRHALDRPGAFVAAPEASAVAAYEESGLVPEPPS